MAKFDLKGMLSERSTKEMDIPEQKTVYRNPEDLIPSEDNFYSTEDTEKLKQSIKCLGILQPLLIENRDGKDYIIAGHSRRKCCLELIEEGEERFRKVPCVYKPKIELPGEEDEIIRKILIIQSNTYREKSDWEKMMESLKMESLVKELREKTELEGKTREIVSDLIGVSSTQIGRYHSISSKLSERLMEAFKQSRLNISTAAELAGLNEKYQAEACKILEETGQVTLNAAKLLKAQQEQERELPGQMTIEEALYPAKPQEIDTVIPVDIQIDRFYESLRKNVETYIRQSDRNMTIYMLGALYGSVRVRNGHLNYQGQKEGILFNGGSDQEELVPWKDFSERLIKKYGKKQKQVKTASVVEEEPENNMPGPAKCITGQSGSGQCGAAAYCNKGYNCCSQCPDPNCNGRCGWIPKKSCQPAAEALDEKQHDFIESTEIKERIVEDDKTSDHTSDPAEMLPENWPEFLKDIPVPTDTEITCYLYDQERDLKQILEIERTEPGPGLPHMTVVQQQMVVAGLRLLQDLIENSKQPEQPPLPEMKNNDQRKEWLRNYKSWGLWYTDHHTGVRYYKYDFSNGARLIAQEYDPEPQKSSWWVPTESCYMHLVGGPEPASKDKVPKWTYHEKYNRFPNSETELVEFLKEVQK